MAALHSVDQSIKAAVVYNPYRADLIDRHELEYRPGATLADYVGDLGDEAAWSVGYKGEAYFKEDWDKIVLQPGEGISLVRVPEGGGGSGKDIMRMVAMIAIAVVAMTVVGPWAAGLTQFAAGSMAATAVSAMAAATFTIAGMMIVNAVMPPAQMTDQSAGGQSYGIDGAKNTSQEGIVVPVIYGEYRVAGNIVDYFTKNVGDDQYLFMRVILNDGLVHSVGEFEINDQPIANYSNTETRVALGTEEGEPNDWFNEAIRMNQVATKLTTNWTTYTTETAVDRIRLDLLYPGGIGYQKDDGKLLAAESDLRFEYRPYGSTGAFMPLTGAKTVNFLQYEGGTGGMDGVSRPPVFNGGIISALQWANFIRQNEAAEATYAEGVSYVGQTTLSENTNPVTGQKQQTTVGTAPAGSSNLTVTGLAVVSAPNANAARGTFEMTVAYREVGSTVWLIDETHSGAVERSTNGNDWSQFPLVYRTSTIPVDPSKRWEVTVFNGSLTNATALVPNGDGELHLLLSKKNAFRYSHESGVLPRGRYEVRARRLVAADESNKKRIDEVYLQDVGEIDIENIHYIGTANVSLKIKLGESLNSVSKFTSLVKGSVTKQFDEEGNVVSEGFSQWPVWHVLDIFMNQDRGRGIAAGRIDFQAAKEWEAHCIKHNLQFNGVFDAESNVWDAVQKICRVGHASLVRLGTKYSFTVDQKSDPVMLFNDSNIIEGTFTTNWLPMLERANEIQYTFYPKDDNFKEKMIRVVDPEVITKGQKPKVARITEEGVTNYEQAKYNVEKQLRENRLIGKTIAFDAPIEAIGLVLGDVAAVQHSSASYAKGVGTGRLKAGTSVSTLQLDAPVKMDPAKQYRVLLIQSTLKRYTATVQQVTGKHVYVSGLPAVLDRCTRLKQGDVETRIENVIDGSPHDRIVVSDSQGFVVGQTVDLYDTDVIEERDVVVPSPMAEVESVTLTAPLSGVPQDHAIWMIGPVATVKSLFRLREIKGDDTHKRSLVFVQYDDQVYLPLGASVEKPAPTPSVIPSHVTGLNLSYPSVAEGQQTRITVTAKWSSDDTYYAGADIYMALDGGAWEFFRTVRDVRQFETELAFGADVQFKVVAIGKNDYRAPAINAPVVAAFVTVEAEELAAPSILSLETTRFRVDATVTATWNKSTSANTRGYRVQYAKLTEAEWLASGFTPSEDRWIDGGVSQSEKIDIAGLDVAFYLFRVRAENGRSVSSWTQTRYDLAKPELPQRVTGLRLNMGDLDPLADAFSGKDAKFIWNDVAASATALDPDGADAEGMDFYWRDYLVRVKTLAGAVIREEVTREAAYTYSIEKNIEDCLGTSLKARRAFRVEVSMRGRQGQESAAVGMNVSNAAPTVPTMGSIVRGVDNIMLSLGLPADSDLEGVIVWASQTAGFTRSKANEVFRNNGVVQWKMDPRKPVYFRYAAYDSFGDDTLNVSNEYATSTTGLTNDYFDPTFYDGVIPADVMARIDLIDGDGPGTVNARVAGVDQRITNEVAGLNERINTVTSTAGNRIFYGTSAPTAGAINDVWINPNDGNRIKRWDGDSWEYADDSRISGLTSSVDNLARATADGDQAIGLRVDQTLAVAQTRNRTFRQASEPVGTAQSPLAVGDLWYATGAHNRPYRYGGPSLGWQDTSDLRIDQNSAAITREEEARANAISAQAQSISTVSAVANAKNRVYRQNTQPTNPVSGDLWIDTTNITVNGMSVPGNLMKRWDGATWTVTQDPRIAANAAAVTDLQYAVSDANGSVAQRISGVSAIAQAKNRTFFQNTAPPANTPLTVGDIWNKSDDNNRQHRWNGSSWQETTDPRTAINAANIQDLQYAVSDANGSVAQRISSVSAIAASRARTFYQNTYPENPSIGDLWFHTGQNNRCYRLAPGGWTETTDTRLPDTVARLDTTVKAVADNHQSMLEKTEVLTGQFGGLNTTVTNHQGVINDVYGRTRAWWSINAAAGGNTAYVTVAADGQGGEISLAGHRIALLNPQNGVMIPAMWVENGRARFTGNVDIDGNLFVGGSITNAKLANDIVHRVEAAYNPAYMTLNNSTPTRIHGVWIGVEKANSPIDVCFNAWATFTHNASGTFNATIQLVRSRGLEGGTVIQSFQINGSGMANDTWQGPIPVMYLDKPGEAGVWHYYVQIYFNVGNMTTQAITSRYGKVTEMKNNTTSLGQGSGSGTGVGSGGGTGGGGGYDPGSGGIGGGGGGTEMPIYT